MKVQIMIYRRTKKNILLIDNLKNTQVFRLTTGAISGNVPLNRDVAGFGTEFSRQDRKCFENRTPGKQKTSNDRG
jgi:hypothetical protein